MFRSILHPTDFSDSNQKAFAHALKLAVVEESYLTIIYADQEETSDIDWDKLPRIRTMLSQWGLIEPDASREDVYEKLGVKIEKVVGSGKKIIDPVLEVVHKNHVDLLVVATRGKEGVPGWIHPSSDPISRIAHLATLFVPFDAKDFVLQESGEINVKEILVPIDHKPKPQQAIDAALAFLKKFGTDQTKIHIFHVWEEGNMPYYDIPEDAKYDSRCKPKTSSIKLEIINEAKEIDADLIVMATEGEHGFMDMLFGSTSEQVLINSPCPILSVPA